MNTISVVVPTLNDAQELKGLLSCLQGQDAEVICGDGGSTDGTIETALSMGASCRVKQAGKPLEMTNLAARESKGDILFFLCADIRVRSDTIAKVREHFDADPSLIGLTGWPVIHEGPLLCKLEYAFYFGLAYLLSRIIFVSNGSFMAARRSAFMALGGFPETYNGDGQLGAKLKKAGKTRFDRGLVYYVSARRYLRSGFFGFNRQSLYVLENLAP